MRPGEAKGGLVRPGEVRGGVGSSGEAQGGQGRSLRWPSEQERPEDQAAGPACGGSSWPLSAPVGPLLASHSLRHSASPWHRLKPVSSLRLCPELFYLERPLFVLQEDTTPNT